MRLTEDHYVECSVLDEHICRIVREELAKKVNPEPLLDWGTTTNPAPLTNTSVPFDALAKAAVDAVFDVPDHELTFEEYAP